MEHTACGRRIFNHLYEEFCLLADKKLERMGLWHWIVEADLNPETLTKDQVLDWLNTGVESYLNQVTVLGPQGWRWGDVQKLSRRFYLWSPTADTPDEILDRMIARKEKE